MKLTTKQLRQMIKEELSLLHEETQEECWEAYNNLPRPVKEIVDLFKDTGDRYAVVDLNAAATGDEALKSYYPHNTADELMAASDFLEMWFYKCPEDMGAQETEEEFDILDFLGENTWIAEPENFDDIEDNLQWFIDEILDGELPDFIDFDQLVALVRQAAS